MTLKIQLTAVLLFLTFIAVSQEKVYKNLIQNKAPGFKTYAKSQDGSSTKVYLGKVLNPEGQILYYVITEFNKVKAANVFHGHSKLLFLSAKWEPLVLYNVGLPERLPFKLVANVLYFKEENEELSYLIDGTLPELLCVEKLECFEREKCGP